MCTNFIHVEWKFNRLQNYLVRETWRNPSFFCKWKSMIYLHILHSSVKHLKVLTCLSLCCLVLFFFAIICIDIIFQTLIVLQVFRCLCCEWNDYLDEAIPIDTVENDCRNEDVLDIESGKLATVCSHFS